MKWNFVNGALSEQLTLCLFIHCGFVYHHRSLRFILGDDSNTKIRMRSFANVKKIAFRAIRMKFYVLYSLSFSTAPRGRIELEYFIYEPSNNFCERFFWFDWTIFHVIRKMKNANAVPTFISNSATFVKNRNKFCTDWVYFFGVWNRPDAIRRIIEFDFDSKRIMPNFICSFEWS